MTASQIKSVVHDTMTALFGNFSASEIERLVRDEYIQHNPTVPTGRAAILSFLPTLKASGISVATHRIIAEGDFVVLHNTYNNAGLFGADVIVAFDVFRVQDGKVAEHWDNLSPAAPLNPSGRSQTDGPSEIVDLDRTTENKALVTAFVETVLMRGQFDQLAEFVNPTRYFQHNTMIADGLEGLSGAIAAMAQQGVTMTYDTLHLVVAEGNFVFTMSQGHLAGKPTAFHDLFRVEDGGIVEHWDIVAEIPREMAHENGKFGSVARSVRGYFAAAGKSYLADFGMFRFQLDFVSPRQMGWAQLTDAGLGPVSMEQTTRVEIRPGVHMVYWIEKTGTRVTHVQDFAHGLVHTNIAGPDGAFYNLTGTLVEVPAI